jgi:hypothetical protein
LLSRTVTLRLFEQSYQAVKQYAEADQTSMNAFIESLLDTEDIRTNPGVG